MTVDETTDGQAIFKGKKKQSLKHGFKTNNSRILVNLIYVAVEKRKIYAPSLIIPEKSPFFKKFKIYMTKLGKIQYYIISFDLMKALLLYKYMFTTDSMHSYWVQMNLIST